MGSKSILPWRVFLIIIHFIMPFIRAFIRMNSSLNTTPKMPFNFLWSHAPIQVVIPSLESNVVDVERICGNLLYELNHMKMSYYLY